MRARIKERVGTDAWQRSTKHATNLRIPDEFFESINTIRRDLLRNLEKIPTRFKERLSDRNCPRCGVEMCAIERMYSETRMIFKCPKCGFSKPVLDVDKILNGNSVSIDEMLAIISIGTVIGLGTHLLAEIMRSDGHK